MVTAALFWEPRKSAINYMVLDDHYQVLIPPKQFNLHTKENFKQIKQEIETSLASFFNDIFTLHDQTLVEYKTVMASYGQGRFDSIYLDKRLKQYLQRTQLPGYKIRSLLKGKELIYFKRALKSLGIRNNWHLWSIALHATKSNWENAIKRIWLAYYRERDLRKKQNQVRFANFIASIKS